MNRAGSASGRINGGLHPILRDPAPDGLHVPRVASSKVAAALTLYGDATRGSSWNLRVTGWKFGGATTAVGNGIIRWWSFVFKDLRGMLHLFRPLLLFEFGDFRFGLRARGKGRRF